MIIFCPICKAPNEKSDSPVQKCMACNLRFENGYSQVEYPTSRIDCYLIQTHVNVTTNSYEEECRTFISRFDSSFDRRPHRHTRDIKEASIFNLHEIQSVAELIYEDYCRKHADYVGYFKHGEWKTNNKYRIRGYSEQENTIPGFQIVFRENASPEAERMDLRTFFPLPLDNALMMSTVLKKSVMDGDEAFPFDYFGGFE